MSEPGKVRTKSWREIADQQSRLLSQLQPGTPRYDRVYRTGLRYLNNITDSNRWQDTFHSQNLKAADSERFTREEYAKERKSRIPKPR